LVFLHQLRSTRFAGASPRGGVVEKKVLWILLESGFAKALSVVSVDFRLFHFPRKIRFLSRGERREKEEINQ
jgi:hypothetical protein